MTKDLIPYDTAGTIAFGNWAKKSGMTIKSWVDARPCDLIVWCNGRGSTQGHVGPITSVCATMIDPQLFFIETAEGNTSQKNYRNGGRFAEKEYYYADNEIGSPASDRYIYCVVSFDKLYELATK